MQRQTDVEKKDRALATRFPDTGGITNCPAVQVPSGSSASEITEAVAEDLVGETSNGHPIYDIANRSGVWMRVYLQTMAHR